MDANKSYDLHTLFSQIAGNVPVIAAALWIVKRWLKGRNKSERETKEAISGIHDKLNRIEMKLAESGISDLKKNMEILKVSKAKLEMNIEALWRTVYNKERTQ